MAEVLHLALRLAPEGLLQEEYYRLVMEVLGIMAEYGRLDGYYRKVTRTL